MTGNDQQLIDAAITARKRAYAKYSDYFVGAAIEDDRGQRHVGCNVENASFPLGSCAEAGAIAAMVAAGGSRIRAIAVAGGSDALEDCMPCGGCRQRIFEFADEDTRILLRDGNDWRSWSIDDLLPKGFSL